MLHSKRSLEERQRAMRLRQPSPRGPGRPPLPITAEDVERFARIGFSIEQIAALLRCCPNTLRNRFREEIESGQQWLGGMIKLILWEKAVVERDPWALKWEAWYRGLYRSTKAPPRPRGTGPALRRPLGRAYKPVRNRYPAGRRSRIKPKPLQFLAPATSPLGKNPATRTPRAWSSWEIKWA